MFARDSIDDEDSQARLANLCPGMVDHNLRQVIMLCWTMLPANKKTIQHLMEEVQRLVDRAFKDLQDDARAFGIEPDSPREA